MKEFEIKLNNLTTQPQTPYSKGGEIFMAENNGEVQQSQERAQKPVEKIEQPPQAPKVGKKNQVPSEQIEAARKAAIVRYGDLEKLPFDTRQTVEAIIQTGRFIEGASPDAEQPVEQAQQSPTPETGGAGGEPPKEPPTTTGGAGEGKQPEFKDPRLRDIHQEIEDLEREGKGVEPDFINAREERIYHILDEKDFTDEEARTQAKDLIKKLVRLRAVSSESQTVFRQELGSLFAKTPFLGIKRFLAEASRIQVRNYEQLEGVHRQLGNAFNGDKAGIDDDFIARTKAMQEAINEERRKKGDPPRALNDAERDQLSGDYREKMRALWDSRKDIRDSLERNFGSARRGLTAAQQASINDINGIEEKIASLDPEGDAFQISELRRELRDSVLDLSQPLAPENEPLPDEILTTIGKDRFATEEFIDRLTRLPQEGKPYHLPGFYSDINLTKFLRLNEDLMTKEDMDHVLNVVAATEVLHEMNRILRTSVDQFAQVSQNILASHLTTLFQVPGVQDAYEIYEEVIKENQSIETVFTERVYDEIDRQVETEFMSRAAKGVKRNGKDDYLLTSCKGEGEMKDWEKKRALIFGRNLVRTLLREGEYISMTSLPKASDGDARSTFISYAQNQLLNIFNPFTFMIGKFRPGESQGGVEMVEGYHGEEREKRRHGRDDNEEATKGIVRLDIVQGAELKNIEATVLVGARGAVMTWRGTDAGLLEFAIMDKGKPSNIKQFFVDHEKEISLLKDIDSKNRWEAEFKRTGNKYVDKEAGESKDKYAERKKKQLDEWKRARVEQVFGPLLRENAVALGTLVSPIPLPGGMPTELKKILWEKIADLDPDTMASILTRLEVDNKAEGAEELEGVKSLEEILLEHFGTDKQKLLLLQAKVSDDDLNEEEKKLSEKERDRIKKEKIGPKTQKLLVEEKDIRRQLEDEKDESRRIELNQRLLEIKSSFDWKPRLVRAEMDKLDEDYKEAKGKMKTSKLQKDIDYWTGKYEDISKGCDLKRIEFRGLEDQVKGLLRCEQWTTLRKKLRIIHALRMEDETDRINMIKNLKSGEKPNISSPKMTLDEYFSDSRLSEEDMIATKEERAVINAISKNGKEIAQDLANIKRAHVWFLEDVPTALMKWENLGQSFYRMITDFSQMGVTANETTALLLDPFKIPMEKALEHLAKMIQGSGSVLGIETAQDNLFNFIMLWNRWQRIKPQYRQKFIEMIRSAGEKDLSIAQEVSRDPGAGAWDEDAAHAVLLTENHMSIMRKEKRDKKTGEILQRGLFEKADKILQCGLFDRLVKANARDYGLFFLLGLIISFFKEIAPKKQ